MSTPTIDAVTCPDCGNRWTQRLYRSVNAERVPERTREILAGTFEAQRCGDCHGEFQPEHTMLYVDMAHDVWIVMYPEDSRRHHVQIERAVMESFHRNAGAAPAWLSSGSRRWPRLVFGQVELAEAVRVLASGLEPALLEVLKVGVARSQDRLLTGHGGAHLVFEDVSAGHIRFGVRRSLAVRRLAEVPVSFDAYLRVAAGRERYEARFPDLFRGAFVSASRSATRG
jgi:hypothetical protein